MGEGKVFSWRINGCWDQTNRRWGSGQSHAAGKGKGAKVELKMWLVLSSTDWSCSDVWRCVHSGHCLPPGFPAGRQFPAVPPTQAVAPWAQIHESDQRGKWHLFTVQLFFWLSASGLVHMVKSSNLALLAWCRLVRSFPFGFVGMKSIREEKSSSTRLLGIHW